MERTICSPKLHVSSGGSFLLGDQYDAWVCIDVFMEYFNMPEKARYFWVTASLDPEEHCLPVALTFSKTRDGLTSYGWYRIAGERDALLPTVTEALLGWGKISFHEKNKVYICLWYE